LASNFHQRPISWLRLSTHPPTLIGCQILPASLPINLQLSPSIELPAQPSGSSLTRVSDLPYSSDLRSACDRRRLPNFRPYLPTNFQPSPSLGLLDQLSGSPPACAFGSSIQLCLLNLPSDSHRRLHSRAASNWSATCAANQLFGSLLSQPLAFASGQPPAALSFRLSACAVC
jgi:hypothetical protein